MADPLRVRALQERLREEVADLRGLAQCDTGTLLADRGKLKSVKYGFIVAIETCIDAGQHVIAGEGYRAPARSLPCRPNTGTCPPTTSRRSSRWPASATCRRTVRGHPRKALDRRTSRRGAVGEADCHRIALDHPPKRRIRCYATPVTADPTT